MSKYTPGPWLIDEKEATFVYALNDEGWNRFSAHVQDAHTPADELEANARLISAVPDLLEAAMAAIEDVMSIDNDHCLAPEVGRKLRAAIAKATGI